MTKTAIELMDEVIKHPTLDDYMRRVPPLSKEQRTELVEVLRADRARFIAKGEEKDAKEDDDG